ncbi:helix-turn-helix transcriptional regulator [Kocuria sp. NPDC057446]|uniref:helix-turn-helix transcriptional regulator n=1 Tax=Kocuria sp. NPDC057446 TaxID=3346137 RepID=UPI0036BE0ADD
MVARSFEGMGEKVRRSVFDTRDRAEGLAVLEQVYAVQGARRGSDEDFAMRVSTAGVGPVGLERVCWQGAPAGGVGEHPGVLRVGQVLGGSVNVSSGRDVLACQGPFLLPRGPYLSWWEGLDILTLTLDAEVVQDQDQARALSGSETLRLEFTGAGPVNPALSRYWSTGVTHLSRSLQSGDEVMSNPLLQAEMTRSLVTALLHTFPNSFLERLRDPVPEPRPASRGVRRAVAFIEAHLGEPIGIVEIAAAARMSPRGLHAAFRREQETTPLAYLRMRRLEAAHAELVAADPAPGVSVAVIAARWGFAHAGRFAAAYRDRYGQVPSATLHT